jgi:hypothetical protein
VSADAFRRSCAACPRVAHAKCGLCGAYVCATCMAAHQQRHAAAPAPERPSPHWRKGGPPLKLDDDATDEERRS